VLLRRRIGRVNFRSIATATLRVIAAAAVLGAVSYGVWRGLDAALGRALWAQIVSVGGALAAGAGAYLIVGRLLGVRELNALLALRRRAE
jgi:putative peptidoglycan lipid II flippase